MKKGEILILIITLIIVVVVAIVFFMIKPFNHTPEINDSSNQIINNTPPVNVNPVVNDSIINETNIPPVNNVNISYGNSLKFSIKASNPQYKASQDITIQYTLENIGNKTINIPINIYNGIELKDSGGRILVYNGSKGGIKVIENEIVILPKNKTTGSFIIYAGDYNLLANGNSVDGYYNSVSAYIGDINSNRVILRILPK